MLRRSYGSMRGLAAAVLMLLPAAPMAAQSAAPKAGTISASIGVGGGSASLSCASCKSSRESNVTGSASLGIGVSSQFVIAGELSGWMKDYNSVNGTGTLRLIFANVVGKLYPQSGSGLFVKAGGGGSFINEEIRRTAVPTTTVKSSGLGLVAGAGWDLPLSGRVVLTPYVEYNRAAAGNATANGIRTSEQLGANLFHGGISIGVR
ncbi:MAG: hypothetical protein V4550_11715 [Gemmatimonadota bacterium]